MAPDDSLWTVATLKEYVERRFEEQEKAVHAALAAAKEAVSAALVASHQATEKSEANAEKWREAANEWRGAMDDREGKFSTKGDLDSFRKESESDRRAIRMEIQGLRESRAEGSGAERRGHSVIDTSRANIALVVAVIGGLVGFASLAFLAARFFGGR